MMVRLLAVAVILSCSYTFSQGKGGGGGGSVPRNNGGSAPGAGPKSSGGGGGSKTGKGSPGEPDRGGTDTDGNSDGYGYERDSDLQRQQSVFECDVTFGLFLDEKKVESAKAQLEKIPDSTLADGKFTVKFKGDIAALKKLEADVKKVVSSEVLTNPVVLEGTWAKTKDVPIQQLDTIVRAVEGVKTVKIEQDASGSLNGGAVKESSSGKITIVRFNPEPALFSITDAASNNGFTVKITSPVAIVLNLKQGDAAPLVKEFETLRGVLKLTFDEKAKVFKFLVRGDIVSKSKLISLAKEKGVKLD